MNRPVVPPRLVVFGFFVFAVLTAIAVSYFGGENFRVPWGPY